MMKRVLQAILTLLLAFTSLWSQKIHIAFLWHMHQPTYFPGETIVETEAAAHYEYSVYGIHTDRTGPYTQWPNLAVNAGVSAGLEHFGAQVSFSGSLIENLDQLESAGVSNFTSWRSSWSVTANQSTILGNPRMDLVAFGYNHPLMALIPPQDVQAQITRHRDLLTETFGSPVSKGIFPPENAFARHMIPSLTNTGLQWVLVDNIHFERACSGYPFSTAANLVEPNGADQINPDPNDWQNLTDLWSPSLISGRWAHQPHFTQYVDPTSGEVSRIIAVPASRYISTEDGRGGFGALQYEQVLSQLEAANTDVEHPILLVITHDGDNYGGGTDSYYQHNFDQFIAWVSAQANRFECTTIQDYLDRYPPAESDVIHIESGSWSGADNGDPEFKKWNADPNGQGYSPDRNSWSVMTAATNLVETATTGLPDQPALQEAQQYLHTGQASDYWYWDWAQGGIWDTHPTRGANLAANILEPFMEELSDETAPSIFLPQREPYNPGATEWTLPQTAAFQVWTLVYDVSGLASVQLMLREDEDGLNDPASIVNELYAGGDGVCDWIALDMEGSTITAQTTELPAHAALEYRVEVSGYADILLDYYVEAVDSLGHMSRSPIQHVFVGPHQGGQGNNPYIMDGELDAEVPELFGVGDLSIHGLYDGTHLYLAAPSANRLGHDVFVLLAQTPGDMVSAPWEKAGTVAAWDVFMANESNNAWSGWFDDSAEVTIAAGEVLEGSINVPTQWPDLPDTLYVALLVYETNDDGVLIQQLPLGNGNGNLETSEYGALYLDHSLVSLDSPQQTENLRMDVPYPNPFNGELSISFTLPEMQRVDVDVFDIQGRLVEHLGSKPYSSGRHKIFWIAHGKPAGVYLIRIKTEHHERIQRAILIR